MINLIIEDDKVKVSCPYSEEFRDKARELHGRYSAPYWVFSEEDIEEVKEALTDIFGENGVDEVERVNVLVTLNKKITDDDRVTLFGYDLVVRKHNRSKITLADNVIVTKGGFAEQQTTGVRPALKERENTVLKVKNVPLTIVKTELERYGADTIEIIESNNTKEEKIDTEETVEKKKKEKKKQGNLLGARPDEETAKDFKDMARNNGLSITDMFYKMFSDYKETNSIGLNAREEMESIIAATTTIVNAFKAVIYKGDASLKDKESIIKELNKNMALKEENIRKELKLEYDNKNLTNLNIIADLTKERDDLAKEVESLKKELDKANNKIEKLDNKIDKLEETNAEQKETIHALEKDIATKDKELDATEKNILAIQEQINLVKTARQDLESKCNTLETENKTKQMLLDSFNHNKAIELEEAKKHAEEMAKLSLEKANMKFEIEKMNFDKQKAELEFKITSLEKELANKKSLKKE